MKKKRSQAKPRTRSRRAGNRPASTPAADLSPAALTSATSAQEAQRVAEGAHDLFVAADRLHKKADALHRSSERLHQSSTALRRRATPGTPAGETAEIVLDEQQKVKARPFPIVGIGASAGGYEACAEFLAHLPRQTGMAFVLVQHLDPKHKSHLSNLLGHSAHIPVVEARNDLEIERDRIYVIPENANLTIHQGRLRLSPRKEHETPPMPIDGFFRSLAQAQQNQAIGVVLSGTGTDGTLGLEAIKGEGGITFAQDDRSAKYFGMPGSAIASGAVDFILSPTDIAKELVRIARHPLVGRPAGKPRPPALAETQDLEKALQAGDNETASIFNLLRARHGVDFSLYKQSTLRRRIIRRMILHKKETLNQYVSLVGGSPTELDALFNDLLINVTSFFRDPQTFVALKKRILARLLKAHSDDSPLRFWVSGCSTGEEAYSLAICLVEFFDHAHAHRPVQIFATDVSDAAIEKARAGVYPQNIQQDVSAERLRRFFTKTNGNFQVNKSIRDMCIFARQNLVVDPPFSNLDLVCCRNVLIYFGPVLQRKLIPLFHYSLRPTGFLLLGNSETIGSSTEHFTLVDKKHKIYVKKPAYLRPGFEAALRPAEREHQEPRPNAGATGSARESKAMDLPQQLDRLLLREYSPATAVVNAQLDVVHFRGRTGLYLEHAPGGASLNLFKMVREGLVMNVRAALSRAQRQDAPIRQSGIEFQHDGRHYEVSLEVVPFRLEPLQERFFAVIFRDYESPAPSLTGPGAKEDANSTAGRLRREIAKLKLELVGTKESMQSIIEEQEATNEELKSANEEIQSSNEELQSTNEELETAKEELQSTNEELTTLNEELQNRNSELSQVNNDLLNLLGSINIAILMVGQDLTLRRFTPTAERLFNLIPSDVGRRLAEVNRTIQLPDLESAVRQAIDELAVLERETRDRDGRWYLLRIRPYRTRENKIDGAVIVLLDIDELRRALDVVLGMVKQPLLMLGADLKVRNANASFLEAFGLEADQVLGRPVYELAQGQWNLPALRSLLEEVLPRNKQITDFNLEANFAHTGFRRLRLNASRFFEEGKGMPLILLAIEEVVNR